jgi:hypothetical protein
MRLLELVARARVIDSCRALGCRPDQIVDTPLGPLPSFESPQEWARVMIPHMEAVQRSLPEHDLTVDRPANEITEELIQTRGSLQ